MGFNTPSKIQETALPTLLADPYVIYSILYFFYVTLFQIKF